MVGISDQSIAYESITDNAIDEFMALYAAKTMYVTLYP